MQVKIVIAGTYMDDHLKALKCAVGDVLDTREWYAQQMVAEGTGEMVGESPKKAKSNRGQGSSGRNRRNRAPQAPSNPFIG